MSGGYSSTTFFTLVERDFSLVFHNSFTIKQGLFKKTPVCMISKDVYIKDVISKDVYIRSWYAGLLWHAGLLVS